MSTVTESSAIDVRVIAPHERHALIVDTFQMLAVGESFDLLSDHEPRPLHVQLMQQWPGQFSWNVLEAGPVQWRIRIGRLAAGKSCCGCCSG